jgi:hypothetical protein
MPKFLAYPRPYRTLLDHGLIGFLNGEPPCLLICLVPNFNAQHVKQVFFVDNDPNGINVKHLIGLPGLVETQQPRRAATTTPDANTQPVGLRNLIGPKRVLNLSTGFGRQPNRVFDTVNKHTE